MMKLELIRSNAAGAGVIYLVLAFQLILIGIPGVVGILFGGRVLAELRKSRGEWPGLDTALIAVLPWPLLVVFAMVGTLLWEAFRALGFLDPSIPLFVVLSLLIGALPAAAIIRLVLRWVMNGTSASPGDRR
jgi:hypothetical protein